MKPSTAVIILNWNGDRLLRRFMPSVIANTPADEARIVVADNGSTDDSVKTIEQLFPTVELLRFTENHGFAEGYNKALAWAAAQGYKYTVLLNSDVEPAPGWLAPLVDWMETHPDCGACQPKIRSLTNRDKFEYAGAAGGFIDRNGYPYCRGRIFASAETDNGQYDTPIQVFWATGAALMVPTKLYLDAGGLDARFFAHMEEIDLCWRINLAGKQIWAVPDSTVYHLGGGSLPAENPRKTYLNFRNNLLLLHKNLPKAHLKATLLRRRLLDTLAWAKYMATFDWANARAIFRAHRDFAKMRRHYTAHPATDLLTGRQRPNILTAYYLHRVRRFSDL
ncbi:MAG: glycosyltransferase family 2 protein [Muribaculaceae bacterium]|nr:glycosyltransferase family 2 protein [Muribaculaceae bacterium]